MTSVGRGQTGAEIEVRMRGLVERRVHALVERWQLPGDSASGLAALVELLAHDSKAPSAVRDPARAVDDHLADALVALELDCVRKASRIADLGSGAGFPGLPLALALPDAAVFLVESNGRKCGYLRRAAEAGAVSNATIINERTEQWTDGFGRHDLVTARAVAPLAVVAEYAAPLLAIGGSLVAWRGRRDIAAEAAASAAATELGLEVDEPRRVAPYPGAQHRYLHAMVKARETPARFPRRPGVAAKRPLGVLPSSPRRKPPSS